MSATAALLLFPHQLFEANRRLARGKAVFLVEDALFFRQYPFHKHKLVLHRAGMKAHAEALRAVAASVTYLEAAQAPDMRAAVAAITACAPAELHFVDPVDDWVERRLTREAGRSGLKLVSHATPMFLSSPGLLEEQFRGRRRARMAGFYAAQRRELRVLVEDGKPVGGRWSFDAENRKRLPAGLRVPEPVRLKRSALVAEACAYVDAQFPGNPGDTADFALPVTPSEARAWLREFVRERLPRFGDYEDAISADQDLLYHSMLSVPLNAGLLEPGEVLDAALGASGVPLNSLEGFVRQLIGWREFVRGAYVHLGRAQRTRNFWGHERPMPASLWRGDSGVAPLDTVVKRVLRLGYCHHIERLMVLANFMNLAGIHPDEVYRWFMALFVDAYDWVMVPNVYGMALHADGGRMTTKPYLSGSNYLLRMSDFPRGDWCGTWDALYWSFIERHRAFFAANPRLALAPRQLDRMGGEKLALHRQRAEELLQRLAPPG